jgi:hypothetical protein
LKKGNRASFHFLSPRCVCINNKKCLVNMSLCCCFYTRRRRRRRESRRRRLHAFNCAPAIKTTQACTCADIKLIPCNKDLLSAAAFYVYKVDAPRVRCVRVLLMANFRSAGAFCFAQMSVRCFLISSPDAKSGQTKHRKSRFSSHDLAQRAALLKIASAAYLVFLLFVCIPAPYTIAVSA